MRICANACCPFADGLLEPTGAPPALACSGPGCGLQSYLKLAKGAMLTTDFAPCWLSAHTARSNPGKFTGRAHLQIMAGAAACSYAEC